MEAQKQPEKRSCASYWLVFFLFIVIVILIGAIVIIIMHYRRLTTPTGGGTTSGGSTIATVNPNFIWQYSDDIGFYFNNGGTNYCIVPDQGLVQNGVTLYVDDCSKFPVKFNILENGNIQLMNQGGGEASGKNGVQYIEVNGGSMDPGHAGCVQYVGTCPSFDNTAYCTNCQMQTWMSNTTTESDHRAVWAFDTTSGLLTSQSTVAEGASQTCVVRTHPLDQSDSNYSKNIVLQIVSCPSTTS